MVASDFIYLLPIFALSGVMVYFVWYKIRDGIPFLYPTGVIMAKEARLLDDTRFSDLVLMPLDEFVASLGNTEYGEYIQDTEYEAIEHGLLVFKQRLSEELFTLIPDQFTDIFEFLLREWDVLNLRTVLTGVHAGLPPDQVSPRLIEGGTMFGKIASLVGEDLTKVSATFEGTPVGMAIEEYTKQKNFSSIDLALDRWLVEDILRKLDRRSEKKLWAVRRYVEISLDVFNLKMMLRGKAGGVPEEGMKRFMLGTEVPKAYGETTTMREFLERMKETRYGYLLTELDENLMRMELRIDEARLRAVKALAQEEAFGFVPLLRFLAQKDAEIRNLRMIAKLKAEGVPGERIKELLLSVGAGG